MFFFKSVKKNALLWILNVISQHVKDEFIGRNNCHRLACIKAYYAIMRTLNNALNLLLIPSFSHLHLYSNDGKHSCGSKCKLIPVMLMKLNVSTGNLYENKITKTFVKCGNELNQRALCPMEQNWKQTKNFLRIHSVYWKLTCHHRKRTGDVWKCFVYHTILCYRLAICALPSQWP